MFVVAICFRAFVYTHLYIAPNEPFGISDVIEALLGFVLLGVLGSSVLAGVVLAIRGPKSNRIAALVLVGVVVVVGLALEPAHTLAPRWSAR
ncbi:hypothetical protein [Piscinibacter sp. XHJ-5]|uniref:hypothetical protein n=1 Tax=Piscinibacter sp. XHJ-5 TaxID=3037797 RepID=UPI002453538E|nr:hypothetical protein [Piscinibacter sp. XHJ-5]